MEWNIENEIREQLIQAYHQYGFNRYLGGDVSEILIEIQTLEKLMDKICINEGIDKKEFLLEDKQND